jgi:hypothetical protein
VNAPSLANTRRAELLTATVERNGLLELRLVYRNAPMRCAIDRNTARALHAQLAAFLEGP